MRSRASPKARLRLPDVGASLEDFLSVEGQYGYWKRLAQFALLGSRDSEQ